MVEVNFNIYYVFVILGIRYELLYLFRGVSCCDIIRFFYISLIMKMIMIIMVNILLF